MQAKTEIKNHQWYEKQPSIVRQEGKAFKESPEGKTNRDSYDC